MGFFTAFAVVASVSLLKLSVCTLNLCLNAATSKHAIDHEVSSSHGLPVDETHIGFDGSDSNVDETPPTIVHTENLGGNGQASAPANRGPLPMAHALTRVPYVNLFKNNQMANENHKLTHYHSGSNSFMFGFDDIDTVEKNL